MKNNFKNDANYWDRKLSSYLHDPPDKALHIPGHEDRSNLILDAMGDLPSLDENSYSRADRIASGMDRAQFPGFSKDQTQNGAVDFLKSPVLTHPTGCNQKLDLILDNEKLNLHQITSQMISVIQADLDGYGNFPGICSQFQNNPDGLSAARFHYIHCTLRSRLAQENVGGLGGLWYRIPADTRIPDHSIWQHCGLVSALSSCFDQSKRRQASLLTFSISPVQDFITRARKLRDLWTGSLILSWLIFEGIREVMYSLGADHVIYPSLIGQPFVNRMLKEECGLNMMNRDIMDNNGVASFPNKFVCLVPCGEETVIADRVKNRILSSWVELGKTVLSRIERQVQKKDNYLNEQFSRQMSGYFDFHWSACPLLDNSQYQVVAELLPKNVYEYPMKLVEDSDSLPYQSGGEGAFYPITHAMSQAFLASGKTHREDNRFEEPGIKCNIHGEMEVLRYAWSPDSQDKNPSPQSDPFWRDFKSRWEMKKDFKPSERLCAVSVVKRIAGYTLKRDCPDHPLADVFKSSESFPSSTEIALTDWLDSVEDVGKGLGSQWRSKLSQYIHETDAERREKEESEIDDLTPDERRLSEQIIREAEKYKIPPLPSDRYYAILMMDGDQMGKMVNGETLASKWRDVVHPDLVARLKSSGFDRNFQKFWIEHFSHRRLLSPAVHSAISESLGEFSLFSVPAVIRQWKGRLIYAGGDDVCAVLPVSSAIQAASDISRIYRMGFVANNGDNNGIQELSATWQPNQNRLAVHLGKGEGISISAGISIIHHKKPLTVAMKGAHHLLKQAKEIGGRNALALELDKRSGGSRQFVTKWDDKPLSELCLGSPGLNEMRLVDIFVNMSKKLGNSGNTSLSSSLIYRLESLKPGLEAIINNYPNELPKFIEKQLKRTRTDSSRTDTNILPILSEQMAALIMRKTAMDSSVYPDTQALIIARFMGESISRASNRSGGV